MFIGIAIGSSLGSAKPIRPSWVEPGAVLDWDYENTRFWGLNRAFTDEAAFLAAIGGVAAGDVRTFGPFIDPAGTNIVTNGDMSDGTTGYAAFGTGASIANVSNELELTCGATALNGFLQPVSDQVGQAFRAQITGRRSSGGGTVSLFGAPANTGASGHSAGGTPISGTSNSTTTGYFGCGPNPTYIGLRNNSLAAATFLLDNFSLVKAWPFPGWDNSGYSVAIDATAAADHAANQTLWQGDAGGADNTRIEIYRNTSGNILLDVRAYNGNTVNINAGAVADGAPFSVAASFAQNNVIIALNGVAASPDTSAVLPGCAYMRIGNNIAANRLWGGTVQRVTVF